jgi:hypothetical protein
MGPVSLSTFAYGRCDLTTANGTKRTSGRVRLRSAFRGKTEVGFRGCQVAF